MPNFAQQMLQASQQYESSVNPKPIGLIMILSVFTEAGAEPEVCRALTDDPHIAPTAAQIKYLKWIVA